MSAAIAVVIEVRSTAVRFRNSRSLAWTKPLGSRFEPAARPGVPRTAMRTSLPAILFLFLPCIALAQEPLPHLMDDHLYFGVPRYAQATDSAEFMRFRSGLKVDTLSRTADTTVRYRLLWQEDQHGGLWMVSRGDSSLWEALAFDPLDPFMGGPFVTADGQRGVLVVHEMPCGLICRNAWYYVEE